MNSRVPGRLHIQFTGEEIVAALAEGSATFQGKTQYSQAKYKKKKQRKYTVNATIQRPTARSICEVSQIAGSFVHIANDDISAAHSFFHLLCTDVMYTNTIAGYVVSCMPDNET